MSAGSGVPEPLQNAALPGFGVPGRSGAAKTAPIRVRTEATARAGLFLWVPVWLAAGITLWFHAPGFWSGPALILPALAGVAALVMLVATPRMALGGRLGWDAADRLRLGSAALLLICCGLAMTAARAQMVAAPTLAWRYYGPVEGRLVQIDRSARDRIRLTLDQVVLRDTSPARTPGQVRLSLMDPAADIPELGQRVMLTGHLGPPPGPAAPGSFDFRQFAWFARIGAVGYTRTPIMTVRPPEGGIWLMHRARMSISAGIQSAIGGQAGAVAAALMTGDRSGISEATNESMRASNLYHIISISGLHMSMLAGFVYTAFRLAMVLAQALGARPPLATHKIAAGAALFSSGVYLWLSGGGVATERSFIMVAVMLGAILCDRRAISLRTVALAATIILICNPESVTAPGFQMSFAATVALILSYGPGLRLCGALPWWLRPVPLLLLSSFIAGIATAPIAAAHFSRMAQYGLLANMLVVPVMGALVMPAGVIAALLAPFGLAAPALWVMGVGTKWMLLVSDHIAGLGGAVTAIPMPPWQVVPMLCFGAVLTILCWRRNRGAIHRAGLGAGLALVLAATLIWLTAKRPALLIGPEGEAVGLMTPAGRALSKPAGGAFTVSNWLLEDGDAALQAEAAARPGWQGDRRDRHIDWPEAGVSVWHFTGKGSGERALAACAADRIVIASEIAPRRPDGAPCLFIDPETLRQTGALAIDADPGGVTILGTTAYLAHPPWAPR